MERSSGNSTQADCVPLGSRLTTVTMMLSRSPLIFAEDDDLLVVRGMEAQAPVALQSRIFTADLVYHAINSARLLGLSSSQVRT